MAKDVDEDQVSNNVEVRRPYEAPEVLASYSKQELEDVTRLAGESGGGGCGCGCGGG